MLGGAERADMMLMMLGRVVSGGGGDVGWAAAMVTSAPSAVAGRSVWSCIFILYRNSCGLSCCSRALYLLAVGSGIAASRLQVVILEDRNR